MIKLASTYKHWAPIEHTVIKNAQLRQTLHEDGYAVVDFLSDETLDRLVQFYKERHQLDHKDGGMFYSLYSKDIEYRKEVHAFIGEVIQDTLNFFFQDYENVINSFVVKAPGRKSAFYLHQDTTALDEFKYSPLSVWIALQDTNSENGCMNIIPKSHWLLSPYRGVTIPFPFKAIQEEVRPYLKPIHLKAGQALLFENRLIHDSSVNSTQKDRVAIVSGVFPKGAEFITCYKNNDEKIELHKHQHDYLHTHLKFYYDCHDRPNDSEVIEVIEDDFPEITAEAFETFCKENGIQKSSQYNNKTVGYDFISEPKANNNLETKDQHRLLGWIKKWF